MDDDGNQVKGVDANGHGAALLGFALFFQPLVIHLASQFWFEGSARIVDGTTGLMAVESCNSGRIGSLRSHSSKSFSDFWSACGDAFFAESGRSMRFLFSTSCALTIMARASSRSMITCRLYTILLYVD